MKTNHLKRVTQSFAKSLSSVGMFYFLVSELNTILCTLQLKRTKLVLDIISSLNKVGVVNLVPEALQFLKQ